MELSYTAALAALAEAARSGARPETERLTPAQALGRVLAQDVLSPRHLPEFANSAVDGFALRSSEARELREFTIAGTLVAGDLPPAELTPPAHAWRIMTGAPFPPGFDCSVKVEDVRTQGQRLLIPRAPDPGENWRGAGLDFAEGKRVLAAGTRVGPEALMALEALGVTEVLAWAPPRVVILSTGAEVTDFAARPGQVRNSTAPYLLAALRAWGAEAHYGGTVGDEPGAFDQALTRARALKPSLILSTGGVSMGQHDYVPSVVADQGGERLFHRVAIRPGKPVLAARMPEGALFIGLPGNPISTVVGLRFFALRYLHALLGRTEKQARSAPLLASVRKPRDLRCFYKARMTPEGRVEILPGQASFMISPLLEADAWAVLPEGADEIAGDTPVEVLSLGGGAW